MHYISRKLMLGKTLDGEFKLLRIRELGRPNDDVDGKPDSTDEDTPIKFSIGRWVVVQCEVDTSCTNQCDAKECGVVY